MSTLTRIDSALFDRLAQAAAATPRRRLNHNFHVDSAEPSQRLLIAMAPDSYVRPHCHRSPPKAETLLLLRGTMAVVTFDAQGRLLEALRLQAGGPCCGVDIPGGCWHSVFACSDDVVCFEVKAGPYLAASDKEWAIWAPAENDPAAGEYLERLRCDVLLRWSLTGTGCIDA